MTVHGRHAPCGPADRGSFIGYKTPEHAFCQQVLKERWWLLVALAAAHSLELRLGDIEPKRLLLHRVLRPHGLAQYVRAIPAELAICLVCHKAQNVKSWAGPGPCRLEQAADALAMQLDEQHRNVDGRSFSGRSAAAALLTPQQRDFVPGD